MKLPKNYFDNLSASKYREYLKLLPNMRNESTKAITMLIFTFVALSVLSIFAIDPTLSTIIDLKKQLEDNQYVNQQLATKMNNLSSLQLQYNDLSNELPVVYNAIPQDANIAGLIGQIEQIAKTSNTQLNFIRVSPIVIANSKQKKTNENSSFVFSVEAQGAYDDVISFAESLTTFNRIVTIESLSLSKDSKTGEIILGITGRGYFNK